jgi:hypothetical protein
VTAGNYFADSECRNLTAVFKLYIPLLIKEQYQKKVCLHFKDNQNILRTK